MLWHAPSEPRLPMASWHGLVAPVSACIEQHYQHSLFWWALGLNPRAMGLPPHASSWQSRTAG